MIVYFCKTNNKGEVIQEPKLNVYTQNQIKVGNIKFYPQDTFIMEYE